MALIVGELRILVRGALYQLFLDGTDANTSVANSLTAFDSDGFTVGSNGGWGGSNDYASWNWKAGTTSGIATIVFALNYNS